ncbi:hypothetical protein LWI28_024679 [Acer negundo]|uniref:Uncharacterized protein n=1 Tax=Acer negundo TaxID=4023 RepID=A0AAD5JV02_ACENE|nr:hypothetical protein LWI28_024679 [Acer negundo]
MISSWLADALLYELWLGSDGSSACKIYYSDLAWPIGKILFLEQVRTVKQQLGITKDNAEWREEEIYRRANIAYKALSTSLGEHDFLFDNMPSSVDAIFHGLHCINKNHRLLVASIESQPFICFLSGSLILNEGVLYGVIERCYRALFLSFQESDPGMEFES